MRHLAMCLLGPQSFRLDLLAGAIQNEDSAVSNEEGKHAKILHTIDQILHGHQVSNMPSSFIIPQYSSDPKSQKSSPPRC